MIKENKFFTLPIINSDWDILEEYLAENFEIEEININSNIYLPLDINIIDTIEENIEDEDPMKNIIESDFWKEAKKFFRENSGNYDLFIIKREEE